MSLISEERIRPIQSSIEHWALGKLVSRAGLSRLGFYDFALDSF